MTQKVRVFLVDDLDGTEATETVTFSLDGASYEIDLSSNNADKLRKELTRYVEHARKANAPTRRRGERIGSRRERSAQIREWARARGLQVDDRDRIPAAVIQEYEGAVALLERVGAAVTDYQAEITPKVANEIIIDVYLDTDDEGVASAIFAAVDELAHAVGIEDLGRREFRRGSILRRSRVVTESGSTERSVEDRLQALESLVNSQSTPPDSGQAELYQQIFTAFTHLVKALEQCPTRLYRYRAVLDC